MKNKKAVYTLSPEVGLKLCWGYFAIRTVVYPGLSTYNTEFVASAVGTSAVGTKNWLSRNSCCASSRRLGSQHCCFGHGRNLVGDVSPTFSDGGI